MSNVTLHVTRADTAKHEHAGSSGKGTLDREIGSRG